MRVGCSGQGAGDVAGEGTTAAVTVTETVGGLTATSVTPEGSSAVTGTSYVPGSRPATSS